MLHSSIFLLTICVTLVFVVIGISKVVKLDKDIKFISTGARTYSAKPYQFFSWYSSQCKMLYHFKPLQTDLKYHLICMHQDALFQYEMPIFAVHWGKKIIIFSLPEVFYDLKYAKNVFVARATPRTQLRELTTLRRP